MIRYFSQQHEDPADLECSDKHALGYQNFVRRKAGSAASATAASLFACPYCWYSTDLGDYMLVHLKRHHVRII